MDIVSKTGKIREKRVRVPRISFLWIFFSSVCAYFIFTRSNKINKESKPTRVGLFKTIYIKIYNKLYHFSSAVSVRESWFLSFVRVRDWFKLHTREYWSKSKETEETFAETANAVKLNVVKQASKTKRNKKIL